MSHSNYLKLVDGVVVVPTVRTLDDKAIPKEDGATWEKFDTEVICPQCARMVGGVVVQDATAHAEH